MIPLTERTIVAGRLALGTAAFKRDPADTTHLEREMIINQDRICVYRNAIIRTSVYLFVVGIVVLLGLSQSPVPRGYCVVALYLDLHINACSRFLSLPRCRRSERFQESPGPKLPSSHLNLTVSLARLKQQLTHLSAAMADGAFRKIDIDQYDPDLVTDTDLYEPFPFSPADALAAAKEREREVRAHISR
jgi:hypothetical protein